MESGFFYVFRVKPPLSLSDTIKVTNIREQSMNPKSQNTQSDSDIIDLIDSMPQPLQQFCHSGQSVNNLAHLAKNMIQVISGSAEIISIGLERKDYDRLKRSWNIFEPGLRRLNKFILDLIKYTKHYPVQKTSCDLNQLVHNAIESCRITMNQYDVRIDFKPAENSRAISLDSNLIEEAIANLITHALDNLPEHTGHISIATKFLKDHNQIQLLVFDDGPALSPETIRALEQPQERTRDMCGTGFEVPLAKVYFEQHDGYMELNSNDNGNSVCVYLPIQ